MKRPYTELDLGPIQYCLDRLVAALWGLFHITYYLFLNWRLLGLNVGSSTYQAVDVPLTIPLKSPHKHNLRGIWHLIGFSLFTFKWHFSYVQMATLVCLPNMQGKKEGKSKVIPPSAMTART